MPEIQAWHVEVALVRLVRELIAERRLLAEVDIDEPVAIPRVLTVIQQVAKGEELAPNVVEHPVKDHLDVLRRDRPR